MNRRALTVAAVVGIVAAPRVAPAIDPGKRLSECRIDSWRSRDGLPGAWVRALAQTPDGYLWVGTQAGLVRYGGGRLLALQPGPGFERAADVMGLRATGDGTLWLTPAHGRPVCVRRGVFSECLPPGDLPEEVRVMELDEDASGAVWIATPAGIHRFAGGHTTLVHSPAAWGGGPVTALHRDRQGRLWVGTPAGLYRGDGAGPLVRHGTGSGQVDAAVASIFESPDGRIWVAAERLLLRIEGDRTTAVSVASARRPTRVIEDRDGNVWVATRTGLTRLAPDGALVAFRRGDGLPDDDVSELFEDREGTLWVGSRGGGMSQFTDRTLNGQAGPPSLRDYWISAVAEDEAGALWVGTNRGLTRWHEGEERTFGESDGLPSDHVLSVHPAPEGLWVGTERGLVLRHRDGQVGRPVVPEAVTSLHRDAAGVLWIGGHDGLARLDHGRLDRVPAAPPLRDIRGMQHDDRGVLWVSAGGRLFRLDGGHLVPARASESDDRDSFLGKVRSLHRDASGTLWLGTHDGLVSRRDGVWRHFGPGEGLTRSDLFQVMTDDLGYLWAGASNGIVRVPLSSLAEVAGGRRPRLGPLSFQTSDQGREVGATRTRQPGAWKGRQGRLWFATSRGVLAINPARVRVNAVPPTVLIEEATVDGHRAIPGGVFPPGAGALEFHFAAITLLEPEKAQHRYLLEGFDRDWVDAGTRRVAYYTNIRPGHYRFRVQGSNADGAWNEAGDALPLTLSPHFYQTVWFYGAAALGALGLALLVHRMRVAQLHGHYAATFAERSRVARELHDSLLQGMAATVMRLRALRKWIAPDAPAPAPSELAAEIKEIEEVVSTNMEETRRFVWDLRDRQGEPPELPTALAQLARRAAVNPGVAIEVHVEGAVSPLPAHARREILRIAQEALNNALAHGQARQVDLRLGYAPDGLRMTVSDDGRGFDPAHSPGVEAGRFGLAGMRERGAALGTLAIESRPGHGTTVALTISRQELPDA
jgi:ligand-binding sensor domain-containing protein/signal transduction histidine kinase